MSASRLIACLGLVMLLAAAPLGRTLAANDAAGFIADMGDRTLKLLQQKQQPEAQRKQQFQTLANQAFDVPKIAQFVLGRYWRSASEEDRQQFVKAFSDYMVGVYWQRFGDYSGESFKVVGQRNEGSDTSVVSTQVVRAGGQPPAKVDWQVAKTGDSYKIRDVSIEGVSQALTYRQEFSSIIEKNNGKVSRSEER